LREALNTLGVVEACLFGLLWFGLGITAFVHVYGGELEHRRRLEAIRRGDVRPETLSVVNLNEHWKDERGHVIAVGRSPVEVVTKRRVPSLDGLRAGERVQAYRFGDQYYLPRFDHFPAWGKFVFLAFALLPVGVAAILLWRKRAGRDIGDPSNWLARSARQD
jgi:hypothetical protein